MVHNAYPIRFVVSGRGRLGRTASSQGNFSRTEEQGKKRRATADLWKELWVTGTRFVVRGPVLVSHQSLDSCSCSCCPAVFCITPDNNPSSSHIQDQPGPGRAGEGATTWHCLSPNLSDIVAQKHRHPWAAQGFFNVRRRAWAIASSCLLAFNIITKLQPHRA